MGEFVLSLMAIDLASFIEHNIEIVCFEKIAPVYHFLPDFTIFSEFEFFVTMITGSLPFFTMIIPNFTIFIEFELMFSPQLLSH